jgi:hypothetical protein
MTNKKNDNREPHTVHLTWLEGSGQDSPCMSGGLEACQEGESPDRMEKLGDTLRRH